MLIKFSLKTLPSEYLPETQYNRFSRELIAEVQYRKEMHQLILKSYASFFFVLDFSKAWLH